MSRALNSVFLHNMGSAILKIVIAPYLSRESSE